jgi:hypothetical protein
MLNLESHQPVPDQKIAKSSAPILILDVDETLILGHNPEGLALETINIRLIDTLIKCGIKEVYLLTAFKLKILKTKAERDEAKPVFRIDLINYLNEKGITVKALISNYDIVLNAVKKGVDEDKESNWFSEQLKPGEYYNTVIKYQEEMVRKNPEIDLNGNKEYQAIIHYQNEHTLFIESIMNLYKFKNPKSPLADLLFTYLKKEGFFTGDQQQTVLFMDDKMDYINALTELAKKHKIKFSSLQIEKPYLQNYSEFLAFHYPLLGYQILVQSIDDEFNVLKNNLPQRLPKFLFFKSSYLDMIQSPLCLVLKVMASVVADIKKNINQHDWVGACNAMIRELIKRQKEFQNRQSLLPLKEQAIAKDILIHFGSAIERLNKIYSSLAIFYQANFNPLGKAESLHQVIQNQKNTSARVKELYSALNFFPTTIITLVSEYQDDAANQSKSSLGRSLE